MQIYTGMDLSRKNFYAYAVKSGQQQVLSGSYAMSEQGLKKLIEDLRAEEPEGAFFFCFEAATESHWVYQWLEASGFETHPFHPTDFAYITKAMRKTDKIDARKMAQVYSAGMLPERVELPTGETEEARRLLNEREYWLKMRASAGYRLKALARKRGVNYAGMGNLSQENNQEELRKLMPADLQADVNRHLCVINQATQLMEECQAQYEASLSPQGQEQVKRWDGVYGVGVIVSWVLAAYVGDGKRFRNRKAAGAYFGLAPRVYQSGERERLGQITKRGPRGARAALLEAAHGMVKTKKFKQTDWWVWYERIREKRGKKKADVALARRLVTTAVHMAQQGRPFEPKTLQAA